MTTHGSGRIPFERLCRDIRDRLFATGVALTANPEDAEDAVQDTLLKLWGVRDRISDAAHFRNLALSVMRHTCLNLIAAARCAAPTRWTRNWMRRQPTRPLR